MDTTSSELASALLQWVNSFDLPTAVNSWRDLEDGAILWSILEDIDPGYFHGGLPEVDRKQKDNWIPRWQNLKHIDRMVTTYIRDECDKLPHLSKTLNPDLKAIAIDGSPQNIIKLVKAVLLAAMYSDVSNERMANVMQNLGFDIAMPIATAIEDMENLDRKLADMGAETETGSDFDQSADYDSPTSYERDPELESEEKLIKALQQKRALENKMYELDDDLKAARAKNAKLEEELAESRFYLDRRRRTTMDEQDLQQLNLQVGRDKDHIAELETDLANATSTIDQQERQIEKLKADDSSKQGLKDELQFVMAERDELRQKSKVNENLKKKIQALQEHEKANASLRKELQSLKDQMEELDNLKERCQALETANEENAQTIANGEQEIFDQKQAKKRMEHDLKLLAQRCEQTSEMLSSAQETIKDFEEKAGDGLLAGTASDDMNHLDAELEAESGVSEDGDRTNEKKPKTPTSSAETIVLQQNLSIAYASVARLEKRCLDLLQENLGLKSDMDEAGEANPAHPFQHQTRRLEALSKELEEIQSKFIASTSEVTDLKRRLELSENEGTVSTEHAASELIAPTTANIERLAQSDEALAQNRERQIYTEEIATQLREHRSLLRHALLSGDSLQKEAENIRSSNEYKLIRQQLDAVRIASNDEAEETIVGTATNLTEKIESGRRTVSSRDKRIEEQSNQLKSMSADLEKLKAQPRAPVPPPKDDALVNGELLNLRRENKLIASAWYDLTCRLQSNTVMLARRQEPPKSWIGKQRVAVGQGLGGSGSTSGRR